MMYTLRGLAEEFCLLTKRFKLSILYSMGAGLFMAIVRASYTTSYYEHIMIWGVLSYWSLSCTVLLCTRIFA